MEIKITTNLILKILQIFSWIIFIGLCIEAGAILFNILFTIFKKPVTADNFWEAKVYLNSLYQFDRGHFFVITLIMAIVAVLKAIMFYLIVKLFSDNKLNMSQPFIMELKRFIINLSSLVFGIGLFTYSGMNYTKWLTSIGAETADLQALHLVGGDVWFFMAVILFVIGQIVNRGIEIQNENELTI